MSDTHPGPVSLRNELWAHALLGAVILLLFGRVIGFPFIGFDDAELILRNLQVTSPGSSWLDLLMTPKVGYVVPVAVGIEAALYALSHGMPWSFHAAALLLHALYAAQLLAFARRLGASLPVAFGAALLFAVHPLVVQPVSWAICLKDLLMANLVLAATHAFLRGTRAMDHASAAHCRLAVALALFAMLAKPTATLLGFAWLAYLLARFLRDGRLPARALFFATLAAGLGALVGAGSRYAHDAFLGEEGLAAFMPSTPLHVLGRQLAHVLWPDDLLIIYPDPAAQPSTALVALGVVALVVAGWVAWRTLRQPELFLLLALAVGIYLPTSNLLPFGRVISDSYMYVPLSALVVACALSLSRALETRAAVLRSAARLVACALVVMLAISSSAQLERWRGGHALWGPVVRAYPRLPIAHRLMGDELLFRGQPRLAVAPYLRSFALYYDPRFLLQFGTILSMAGRTRDAECVLIEAAAFGTDRGYAVYNYAALLAFDSAYESRYPAIAKQLLGELQVLRRAGKVPWPAQLEPGLAVQLERLRSLPNQRPTWSRRNCEVLKSK